MRRENFFQRHLSSEKLTLKRGKIPTRECFLRKSLRGCGASKTPFQKSPTTWAEKFHGTRGAYQQLALLGHNPVSLLPLRSRRQSGWGEVREAHQDGPFPARIAAPRRTILEAGLGPVLSAHSSGRRNTAGVCQPRDASCLLGASRQQRESWAQERDLSSAKPK